MINNKKSSSHLRHIFKTPDYRPIMKYKKHITKALAGLFLSITIAELIIFWVHYEEAKYYIHHEIRPLLEEAMRKDINEKMKKEYFYYPKYENDPKKKNLGKYEKKTYRSQDTTFTYQSKVVDWETDLFRGSQCYLQVTNKLHPQEVKTIFDSLATRKKIIATKSAIGIISTFYKEQNEWAGDTTSMSIDYRTSIDKLGGFENISYLVYLDYSFGTIWKLMPKIALYILLLLQVLCGITLIGWLIKRAKERRKEIVKLKNGNYKIDSIIFNPNTMKLTNEEKELVLPAQQNQLLLLFLQSEDHKVSKDTIMDTFWAKNYSDSRTKMTTAIDRLRTSLKGIESERIIYTQKGSDYYELI